MDNNYSFQLRGMATKKAVGSTKNGRDSNPQYLGGIIKIIYYNIL